MDPITTETVQARRRQALTIWSFSLITPILYLALGWLVETMGWIEIGPDAERPADTPLTRALLVGLGVAALTVGGLWRLRRRARVARQGVAAERRLEGWMFDFYVIAGAADAAAFLGLVGFLLTSRQEALLIGGMAGYLGYAFAYPARGELERLST